MKRLEIWELGGSDALHYGEERWNIVPWCDLWERLMGSIKRPVQNATLIVRAGYIR